MREKWASARVGGLGAAGASTLTFAWADIAETGCVGTGSGCAGAASTGGVDIGSVGWAAGGGAGVGKGEGVGALTGAATGAVGIVGGVGEGIGVGVGDGADTGSPVAV